MFQNPKMALAYCVLPGLVMLSMPICSHAAPPVQKKNISQLREELIKQNKQLAAQQLALKEQEKQLLAYKQALDRALQEQGQRIDAMKAQLDGTGGKQASQPTNAIVRNVPPQRVAKTDKSVPEVVGQAPERPKESKPPQVAPIFDQPGVLTAKGKFVFEPSLQYSYSSSNRVALVGFTILPAITIGLIDIRSVSSSTWIGALTARYGLTNRLEVEAKLPYAHRSDSTLGRVINNPATADSVFDSSGSGIGDVELAARYQFNDGGENTPYYVGTLRVKTRTGKDPFEVNIDPDTSFPTSLPTGSGFYGIEPGITVIYPSDPAVFFGSVSYLWNIKRDINRDLGLITDADGINITNHFGTVDPGDAFNFNFGMGFALNEKASFSLGYAHSVVDKDKVDGTVVPQAQTRQLGSLLLGFAYRLSDKTSVNLSLGAGLTRESPDVQLTLRVPMTF